MLTKKLSKLIWDYKMGQPTELLLEERLRYPEDKDREWERIQDIWKNFLRGRRKTIGVENIYPMLLGIRDEEKKRDNFLKLKTSFKPMRAYTSQSFGTKFAKDKAKEMEIYSNEPRAIRVYSLLSLISMLGGYKENVWVSRKELSVVGHMSLASVGLCESLYKERFIEKQQEPRSSMTKGSISYKLGKTGKEILGKVDSSCRKIDTEAWQGFRYFLDSRIYHLSNEGYIDTVKKNITYNDKNIPQEIVYTNKKIDPSRSIIGELDDKLLIIKRE